MDIKAKLEELRKKKAAEAIQSQEIQNAKEEIAEIKEAEVSVPVTVPSAEISKEVSSGVQKESPRANANVAIGTERTSEIDHLAFMSQMQELQEAIHAKHPRMPVLLMTIHKHLRNDPELVTTLSEDDIGIIVNGLKVQTKTELAGTIVKQAKSRDKKTALSTDMF